LTTVTHFKTEQPIRNLKPPMICVQSKFGVTVWSTHLWELLFHWRPREKRAGKICRIINDSAVCCLVLLKFGMVGPQGLQTS